ncbi:hypothetical protein ACQRC1_10705, partial [Megasphaera elsdenii]
MSGFNARKKHKNAVTHLENHHYFPHNNHIIKKEVKNVYLTQSNVIRNLSKEDYAMLREMCQYSN